VRDHGVKAADEILDSEERVIYRTTPSWTIYGPAATLAVCALVALVVGTNYQLDAVGVLSAATLLLIAIVNFIPAWFRRATTEIAVTDRRIILKRGFIRRHTVEMNMQKVETVDVDQTLIGRLFNYGNVTLRGSGSTVESFRSIDAPLKLRTCVTAKS
jgi:uncharacterized membrane protein YdbT with pleckstrin-like domain